MQQPILLLIPDVHGRTFWKEAVSKYPKLPTIFLGDYLDPYTSLENITINDAITNFKQIITYKNNNKENTILLLGNHDIHYLSNEVNSSRKSITHYKEINQLFIQNFNLFKLAYTTKTNIDKNILITHAGVIKQWLQYRMPDINSEDTNEIETALNKLTDSVEQLTDFDNNGLFDVSASRGGYDLYPSPLWADITDHYYNEQQLPNIFQIFGHTMLKLNKPFATEHYACIDCKRYFLLMDDGEINE